MYNNEKFIEKASKRHDDLYDYSLTDYISSKIKVKIICKVHGVFEQTPAKHLSGRGCPICGGSSKKTNDQFKIDSEKTHGDLYDYSLSDYKNANTLVKIICKKHGVFEQNPYNHIKGSKCPKCYLESKFKTNEQFKIDSEKVHGDLYDYSKTDYYKNNITVEIICRIHGSFFQQPSVHLSGGGCPKCADNNKRLILNDFKLISSKIHNNYYDYSKSTYFNNYTKTEIICPEHGSFFQIPNFHLLGQGCPSCKKSIMENYISNILIDEEIKFERQKTFEDCKNINKLPFDFYLPELNICIEYNGKQHYEPIEYFGGDKTFEYIKNNDRIKKEYCENNNIQYLEISYLEKNDYICNLIKKIKNKC